MADTLTFSLVSPERELFSGQVDQVDIPGTEGDMGILLDHTPLMAAIRTGAITVFSGGTETKYFVQGGFADATAEGLTVLAEQASLMSDVEKAEITAQLEKAQAAMAGFEGEAALLAQQNLDGLTEMAASL